MITGRFVTRQVDEIARAVILAPDRTTETLEGTPIHPTWSVDRQDWIPLGELSEDEQLQAAGGVAVVLSLTILRRSLPVYNIAVHGEHVYQVGELGLLVHNSTVYRCMDNAQFALARIGKYIDSPSTDFPGFHFVWDNLESARSWLNYVRSNGDDQSLARIETKLDISEYESFRHPPQGTAYIVPFDDLGPAIVIP